MHSSILQCVLVYYYTIFILTELRKLRSDKTPAASTLGATSSGRQHNVQSFLQSVKSQRQSQGGGVRLAPPYINMSHSVRF